MKISLVPIDETNREAVMALSVHEDQPFVAPNDYSLKQADAEFFHEKIDEISDSIVPPMEGTEDCLKGHRWGQMQKLL